MVASSAALSGQRRASSTFSGAAVALRPSTASAGDSFGPPLAGAPGAPRGPPPPTTARQLAAWSADETLAWAARHAPLAPLACALRRARDERGVALSGAELLELAAEPTAGPLCRALHGARGGGSDAAAAARKERVFIAEVVTRRSYRVRCRDS